MLGGIFLRGVNALFFKSKMDFFFEFIPQIIFMSLLFGYMIIMIFIKWSTDWSMNSSNAPSIISTLMNIFLKLGSVENKPLYHLEDPSTQENLQYIFLIISLLCLPIILFPKPILTHLSHKKDKKVNPKEQSPQLEKAKDQNNKNINEEASRTIYRAAYDAFANFKLPPVQRKAPRKSGKGTPETAVAVFADWQLGKVTPDYNSNVLAKRIDLYTEKLLEIVEVQRADHAVDNLHVWLLGDIVEGEEIFPGQSHLIDSGIYRQVGINGPEILSKFFSTALENFDKVNVTAVIGNHGSVGGKNRKMYDPESNMDRLLYKILSLIFASNERIQFNIPDGRGERHWYAVDKIGNYSTLLIHGDQLPSPTSVAAYSRKVLGWKDGAIPEEFQDVFMGHYHQRSMMTIGSTVLRISGSPESYNTYAQEYFNSMSRPCQQLLFVHPENGVTSEYSVWLDAV